MNNKYGEILLELYDYALMGTLELNSTEKDRNEWRIKRNEYGKEILELMNKWRKINE